MKILPFFKPEKQLLKVISFNSIGTLVRLICGFILNKLLAIFVGPSGIGLIGNLRSFLNSLQAIASLGFYNGVIKYSAEYKTEKNQLSRLFSTTLIGAFFSISISSLILFFFSDFISLIILNTKEYGYIFKVLALAFPIHILNYFLLGFINGLEKYKSYISINIILNVVNLLITAYLVFHLQLSGVLIAICVVPSLGIVISLTFCRKVAKFPKISTNFFDKTVFKNLFEYSVMALITAVLVPPTFIAIRNHLITVENLEAAGYWEAMNRISNYYLIFVTSLLSLYLYPKLSKTSSIKETRSIILSFYKTLLPPIIVGLIVLFFSRFLLIKLLLSNEFYEVGHLFIWQLPGDLFKILSSVLAFQFFAKKMTLLYVVTEVISVLIWYSASIYLINNYGYTGASMGYFVCYFTYFIMMLIIFRKQLFFVK